MTYGLRVFFVKYASERYVYLVGYGRRGRWIGGGGLRPPLEVGGFAPHLQHDDMFTSAVKGVGESGGNRARRQHRRLFSYHLGKLLCAHYTRCGKVLAKKPHPQYYNH